MWKFLARLSQMAMVLVMMVYIIIFFFGIEADKPAAFQTFVALGVMFLVSRELDRLA